MNQPFYRSLFLILTVALATGCRFEVINGGFQFDFQGQSSVRDESGEIPPGSSTIEISNRFGDVKVEVTEEPANWTWQLTCWADEVERAEELTQSIILDTRQEGDRFICRLEMPQDPSNELRGLRSDLVLQVPHGVAVELDNQHGHSEVSGTDGPLSVLQRHGNFNGSGLLDPRVDVAHGNADLKTVAGTLEIKVSHGKAVVDDVQEAATFDLSHASLKGNQFGSDVRITAAHGDSNLGHVSGAVTFEGSHGGLTAENVTGSVNAKVAHDNIKVTSGGSEIYCHSRHGNVLINMTNADVTKLDANASHGNIDLYFASGLEPVVSASANHGNVRTNFQLDSGSDLRAHANHGNVHIGSMSSR